MDPSRPAPPPLPTDPAVGIWSALLARLDGPMAIVDRDGVVLWGNPAARQEIGGTAFDPSSWSIRPIDEGGTYYLACETAMALTRPAPTPDPVPVAPSLAGGDHEDDLRDNLLRQFFSTDGVMFVVVDPEGEVVEANEALTVALGSSRADTIGVPFERLIRSYDAEDVGRLGHDLADRGQVDLTAQMPTSGGSVRHIHWSIRHDPSTSYFFGIGRDITAQREATEELRRLAYTDALTGLANRAALLIQLDEALTEGRNPAVLFCDLDRFKIVNDSLGHAAGDELLRTIGRRLEDELSEPTILAARLGGDEFVVVITDADEPTARSVADRLRRVITAPFTVHGRDVHVGVSVGIAMAEDFKRTDAEHLLGEADTAAYHAKETRRGGVVVHDTDLQKRLERRFDVEAGLIVALAEDQFEVRYQPIVELPGGGILGVEGLVRWRDDEGVLRQPAEFVGIAEDAGLLEMIGDRVLAMATRDLAELGRNGRPVPLAVNATAGQISDSAFPGRVRSALTAAGLPPEFLTIELTESAIVGDLDKSLPVMADLRSSGIRLAVDDFGTGYSSLSYLQQLPIDIVKIDRSFTTGVDHDEVARSVIRSVVGLCRALQLDIVVEGVETTDQAAAIEQLGCSRVQGFLFHEPLTIDQLTAIVSGLHAGRPVA